MKKFIYPLLFMFLVSFPLFAEISGIEISVVNISNVIRMIFPNLLGVIFLVGFLFHTGLFFGVNVDLKLTQTGRCLYGCYTRLPDGQVCPLK